MTWLLRTLHVRDVRPKMREMSKTHSLRVNGVDGVDGAERDCEAWIGGKSGGGGGTRLPLGPIPINIGISGLCPSRFFDLKVRTRNDMNLAGA